MIKNLFELIDSKSKDEIFCIEINSGYKITFGEFVLKSKKLANYFKNIGLNRGDVVTVISRNNIEYLLAFFSSWAIGVIVNPINPDLSSEELSYILKDSGSKLVIADSNNIKKSLSINTISIEKLDQIFEKFSDKISLPDIKGSYEAVIMYSSGTTGHPKGIVLTHGSIISGAFGTARACELKDEITLLNLPFFFSGGLIFSFLVPLAYNSSFIMIPKFSVSKFWKNISDHKVTYTILVPTMVTILLNSTKELDYHKISNLKFINIGAAPVPKELFTLFEKKFNINLYEVYGLTENSAITAATPPHKSKRKVGSVGIPIDCCEIKIVDSNGNTLPNNTEGEIIIKGPHLMKEYHNQEEKTKDIIKNGYLYSGDLGYLDDDNYLYISGRKKFIIIKGGENISPRQIDEVFYKHLDVMDAATIGIPDKLYGEEIKTYIVKKPNSKITSKDLKEYCKEHLEVFKCPKEIEFIDSIPKGPSGKLLSRVLLERHLKK